MKKRFLKKGIFLSFFFMFVVVGCHRPQAKSEAVCADTTAMVESDDSLEVLPIRVLIRSMLRWSDSADLPLEPVVVKDGFVTGIDWKAVPHQKEMLKQTGFFHDEFVVRYDSLLRVVDAHLTAKTAPKCREGELLPYSIGAGASPWLLLQDTPSYADEDPYNHVEVALTHLKSDVACGYWYWDGLAENDPFGKKQFRCRFQVKLSDGRWEITYLEGFKVE